MSSLASSNGPDRNLQPIDGVAPRAHETSKVCETINHPSSTELQNGTLPSRETLPLQSKQLDLDKIISERNTGRSVWKDVGATLSDIFNKTKEITYERITYVAMSSAALLTTSYISTSLLAPVDDLPKRLSLSALLVGPAICLAARKYLLFSEAKQLLENAEAKQEQSLGLFSRIGNILKNSLPWAATGAACSYLGSQLFNLASTEQLSPLALGGMGAALSVAAAGIYYYIPKFRDVLSRWVLPFTAQATALSAFSMKTVESILSSETVERISGASQNRFLLFTAVGSAFASWFLYRRYDWKAYDLKILHTTQISNYLSDTMTVAAASLPPEAHGRHEIAEDIVELRRNEFNLKSLINQGLQVVSTAGSTIVAGVAVAVAGYWYALLPVGLAGWLSYRSAQRCADRACQTDEELKSKENIINYHRVDLSTVTSLTQLYYMGTAITKYLGAAIQMRLFTSQARTEKDRENNNDDYRTDIKAELAMTASWATLVWTAHDGRLPWATLAWLCHSLWSIKGEMNSITESLSYILPFRRIASTRERLMEYSRLITDGKTQVERFETAPEIVIENVRFTYEKTGIPPLGKDGKPAWHLSIPGRLVIPAGAKVGIAGENGAGKSTLVNLLRGTLAPSVGQISVGGYDLATHRVKGAHLLQEAKPFNAWTIEENIDFWGGSNSDSLDAEYALKLLGVEKTVLDKKPKGVKTLLGENLKGGKKVSGGQAQMILLAGLTASGNRFITLDEATSNIDVNHVAIIHEALNTIWADRTVFIIAHDFSQFKNVDFILFVKGGHITEIGTHDELIALDGGYAAMFKKQVSVFKAFLDNAQVSSRPDVIKPIFVPSEEEDFTPAGSPSPSLAHPQQPSN